MSSSDWICPACKLRVPRAYRFCAACGGRRPEPTLEVARNAFLVEGMAGVVRFRVGNPIDELVDVNLECALCGNPIVARGARLEPQANREFTLPVRPEQAGVEVANITLRYGSPGGLQRTLQGEICLTVLPPRQTGGDVKIDMRGLYQNIQKQYANELNINIDRSLTEGEQSYDDLLRASETPIYDQVDLEPVTRRMPGTGAILLPVEDAPVIDQLALDVACELGSKTVLLVSRSLVRLGRAQRDSSDSFLKNDLVVRVLPVHERQQENYALNRFQCEIHLRDDGAYLLPAAGKPEAASQTKLDGQPLSCDRIGRKLDTGALLSLSGVLDFDVAVFPHDGAAATRVQVSQLHPLLDCTGFGSVAAVRLKRRGNHSAEEYVILAKSAAIGSDQTNTIVVPGTGIGNPHARILRYMNRYWLTGHDHLAVCVEREPENHRLRKNQALALQPGDRIVIGPDTCINVREFAQRLR